MKIYYLNQIWHIAELTSSTFGFWSSLVFAKYVQLCLSFNFNLKKNAEETSLFNSNLITLNLIILDTKTYPRCRNNLAERPCWKPK